MKTTLFALALPCACFIAPTLVAQTPSAPTSDTPADLKTGDPEGEVLTLSEFTVSASTTSEYAAAESLTGTRVASRIQELPFAVNVVTADFMDDFLALEWSESLAYVSNVGQSETQSPGYTLRGFEADVQLRNGFRRIGLVDKVAVERTEVIKGPAASIYGTVLPGGIVNVITKKPAAKPHQEFSVTAGSYDLFRAEASSTGPLVPDKLFYRVDLATEQRSFETPYREKKVKTVDVQVLTKFGPETSLLLEAEYLKRDEPANTSATVPMLVRTGVAIPWQPTRTMTQYLEIADEAMLYKSTQGPETYANREISNLLATFEHRFNRTWALRASGSWFDRDLVRVEVGSRDQYNPVTRTVQRGTARHRLYPEGGLGMQADLLGSFETGELKHRLLLTVDYQQQTQEPSQQDAATNAAFPADVATGLKVDNPNYEFTTYLEDPSLYTLASASDDQIDILGFFLSERLSMLDNRLIMLAGVRFDTADSRTRDVRAGTPEMKSSTDQTTYQLGVNYRLAPGVMVYANHSTSFVPPFGSGTDIDGNAYTLPNEEGSGSEVGVKVDLLGGKVSFTTSLFDISRENLARNTNDPDTGAVYTVISGKEVSKGVEVDLNWVATSELQFFGSYGYTDAYVESHPELRWLEDVPLRRAPRHNGGVGAKYEIKEGALKGAYFTFGLRYFGESLANPGTGQSIAASNVTAARPFINTPYANGNLPFPQYAEGAVLTSIPYGIRVPNGRETVMNEAYSVVDAGIGYKWRSHERFRHKVQLNIKNVGDLRYTYGSSAPGDPLNMALTYDLSF